MQTIVHLLGRDSDVDHGQIIGGETVKLLGRYIPPGFDTPGPSAMKIRPENEMVR